MKADVPGFPAFADLARRLAAPTLALAILALSACAAMPFADVVRVDSDDSAKGIDLRAGQVLEIVMQSYPASNLTLSLGSVVAPTLVPLGRPSFHDNFLGGRATGTGNYEVWRFSAVQPGAVDVRMDYRLPWQTTGQPNRSVTYQVVVR